ncbi:MAG: hypothetical protein C5B60_10550 [Chloroflexi bacterium]|nr:MAG: hypothetical protein C5B60_10550 [Chloroflexota bacterium]
MAEPLTVSSDNLRQEARRPRLTNERLLAAIKLQLDEMRHEIAELRPLAQFHRELAELRGEVAAKTVPPPLAGTDEKLLIEMRHLTSERLDNATLHRAIDTGLRQISEQLQRQARVLKRLSWGVGVIAVVLALIAGNQFPALRQILAL